MSCPAYDLSCGEAIAASAKLARIRAGQEPDQSSYNAAWLHGYADALSHATDVLESQQEFISALVDHLKEQHDQTELYDILHDTLGLADKDILALGIDLPQHKAYTPEVSAGRKKRRNGYDER